MKSHKRTLKLISGMIGVYAISYLIVGALAYALITKQFYVGDSAIFTMYLRSESSTELWAHVTTWQFPMLFLRSLLIALVMLPFVQTLKKMSFWKSVGITFCLLFTLTHLAAAAPSSGNIEGVTYIRPELLRPDIFFLLQPEMIIQSLLVGIGFTYLIRKVR